MANNDMRNGYEAVTVDGKRPNALTPDGSFWNDTGAKYDQDKPRMDLIPPHAELLLAQVLTFGAEKYAPNNWRNVEDPERRYLAAAMRHINAHRQGELMDSESGLPHLAHAMCCLAFVLEVNHD